MSGEKDLDVLLAAMTGQLDGATYVFATLKDRALPAGIHPKMMFQEGEGTTYILTQTDALAHGIAHEFPCRMITLNIHSALDAVGFIARIATELAAADMGVNPVAGFYHDHLFVPAGREVDAMTIISDIAERARHANAS